MKNYRLVIQDNVLDLFDKLSILPINGIYIKFKPTCYDVTFLTMSVYKGIRLYNEKSSI